MSQLLGFSFLEEPFRAFDEAYLKYRTFVLAFSGGKDSTAVAVLFYKWLKERGVRDVEVVLLHNDTLSEIPDMETWARYFMDQFEEKMKSIGIAVRRIVAAPSPLNTWYWRVYVRGYPASTFNFRWCVDLLKVEPTMRALKELRDYILVVGSRDEESAARAKSMQVRFGKCMREGSCLGAYFAVNNDIPKVAPIRFWSLEDVWRFLKTQRDFDVKPLLRLYLFNGNMGVRYGCWHCTLVKRQWGNYIDDRFLYAEAVRVLYRVVSDMETLRTPKSGGYSRLGPINALGRSIIFNAVRRAEELGGEMFYGLNIEVQLHKLHYTLRVIFYELSEKLADDIISALDPTDRRVSIHNLRDLKSNDGWREALDAIESRVVKRDVDNRVRERLLELLRRLY
ncbi:phosphoadenosine phosphosulfate reductase family protein [Pyrobaculum ferrireducens]|uniref:Phosphoadenosine phosphosulfate reductase n=1 Tax=Pyrobaculum ferrireducens TaxID=1104324 RepID=G7VE63_9CREN|nr:phosphoadenosine phosphosulfate reductase family protein [Pyrobaculum ferrireducens]AET32836.1 phosphoadenosine phosphosulfate reductase [Pyrobaculum ferrireducens]